MVDTYVRRQKQVTTSHGQQQQLQAVYRQVLLLKADDRVLHFQLFDGLDTLPLVRFLVPSLALLFGTVWLGLLASLSGRMSSQ